MRVGSTRGNARSREVDESDEMTTIVKRSGAQEPFDVKKVRARIEGQSTGMDPKYVDASLLLSTVQSGITDKMASTDLDTLLAEVAAHNVTRHPDYGLLAGRLAVTNLHKTTHQCLKAVAEVLYRYTNPKNGQESPLISEEVYNVIQDNYERLSQTIDFSKDLNYEYFGFKTLERSYLLRVDQGDGKLLIAERPQHMLMRVSIGIHGTNIDRVVETYQLLSDGLFTHATPTLFNAGTPQPQMSSCFLVKMKDDSIDGIYETLKTCALISKCAGGIGVNIHNIRCQGSYIRGSNGTSNGLVPMLRVFNDTARYVDQGGGKRKGSFAMYLEPWHGDIFDFLQLKKNHGKEEQRARDLFYALWIPDLFMKRVQENGKWTLFDPNVAKGLADVYGDEFEQLYSKYEQEGLGVKTIEAHTLWYAIVDAQIETGTPYMLYKDACNKKSNQNHLGTIKCSNLCTEIVEYTASDEVAVCNLASLALPKFVREVEGKMVFDHEKLVHITRVVTRNLNNVIDKNYYPVKEASNSNFRHRPIGIGVQGLADAFLLLGLPFASPEAKRLNEDIFESIYYGAVSASNELAKETEAFPTFKGCPMSKGQLQFDMWGVKPKSGRYDWDTLRKSVVEHGVKNSLLIAPMPTASTSQILGNNECFEPFTSNIYVRRVLSGEFPVVNKHLVKALIKAGLWSESTRNQIIANNGSVQGLSSIPESIREMYKTVWEIKQKDVIDMAADRAAYIDQSQSLNLFLAEPKPPQVTSMHFYAWRKGLKTGMYYLRTRPAADAIKFTVDQQALAAGTDKKEETECLSCGS